MELILDVELEVKVILYETEEERDKNIEEMKKVGFTVKRSGLCNVRTESTITAYMDEANWKPYAEFTKTREKFKTKDNISYETDMYWFNVYNPVNKTTACEKL